MLYPAIRFYPYVNPVAIIFSGTAGGLDRTYEWGQTVIAKTWYSEKSDEAAVQVDNTLYDLAQAINQEVVFVENGVTSWNFVSEIDVKTSLHNQYNAAIVDMESYYIAQVAFENNIPFIAIRTVSDYADGENYMQNFEFAAEKSAVFTLDLISILLQENP